MFSTPLMLLLVAVGVAVIAQLVIPLFEQREMDIHLQKLAAVKAVHVLQNKVKPGIYTFRWVKGRMLEPVFEKLEGHKVIMRFTDDDRVSETIQEMPIEFQRQILELIRFGMTWKKS